jgi:hypothetical protein
MKANGHHLGYHPQNATSRLKITYFFLLFFQAAAVHEKLADGKTRRRTYQMFITFLQAWNDSGNRLSEQ